FRPDAAYRIFTSPEFRRVLLRSGLLVRRYRHCGHPHPRKAAMTQTVTPHTEPRRGRRPVEQIRPEGLYRWNEFEDRIPFSRETSSEERRVGNEEKTNNRPNA